jgi:hypothetical protein
VYRKYFSIEAARSTAFSVTGGGEVMDMGETPGVGISRIRL